MWDSCNILKLTTACKRINKDRCCDLVAGNASSKRSKKNRTKSSARSSSPEECLLAEQQQQQPVGKINSDEHLSEATPTSPINLPMIISQSYKPLHAKSTQFNRKTIAVTKGTRVKALYKVSNWAFVEVEETGASGLIPLYCLREISHGPFESPSQTNISLFNVSVYDKPRYSRLSIMKSGSYEPSTPQPSRFVSSIGPCQLTASPHASTCPRLMKTRTYTRQALKDQSTLSMAAPDTRHPSAPVDLRSKQRLRVLENYQRQFVGDISVLESEVVVPVENDGPIGDWRLVRRGDGKQGYIPEHIVMPDSNGA